MGTDTPEYILQSCNKIGYRVQNEGVRLQARNDSFNCGPLVINTLLKYALGLKIRPTRNLLRYANTLRTNDQAILKEYNIHTPEALIAFYSEHIHHLIMNDDWKETPKILFENLWKKREDTFV